MADQPRLSTQLHDCYPGGNSTYIVLAPNCDREQYAALDAAIKTKYPHFEQGGFIEPAASEKAVLRLQMAGGEFCGNAARSFGALIADAAISEKVLPGQAHREFIVSTGEGAVTFPIEISGTGELLTVHCRKQGDAIWVETEIPIPAQLHTKQHQIIDEVESFNFMISHVALPGIDHVLIKESDFPFPDESGRIEKLLHTVERLLGLSDSPAIGLIWYNHHADGGGVINPVVYVRSINSLINETACGSGSIALHLAVSNDSSMSVLQPSGSILQTTIRRSTNGSINRVLLSGEVKLQGCQSYTADQFVSEFIG